MEGLKYLNFILPRPPEKTKGPLLWGSGKIADFVIDSLFSVVCEATRPRELSRTGHPPGQDISKFDLRNWPQSGVDFNIKLRTWGRRSQCGLWGRLRLRLTLPSANRPSPERNAYDIARVPLAFNELPRGSYRSVRLRPPTM